MAFANQILGGQNKLIRPAIQSPDFAAGSAGWRIGKDGSAEFNNVTIRGATVQDSTDLWYSGTPAVNTLLASVSNTIAQDTYGNWHLDGVTSYGPDSYTGTGYIACQVKGYTITWYYAAAMTGATLPWTIKGTMSWNDSGMLIQYLSGPVTIQGNPVNINTQLTAEGGTAAAPTLITTDTWNQITPGGSWANSGNGVNGFFYRLLPTGDVLLAWDVSISSATPGTLGTLPAGYRPATGVNIASGWYGTGPTTYNDQFAPHLNIATTGAITGQSLYVGTIALHGTAILPLGTL